MQGRQRWTAPAYHGVHGQQVAPGPGLQQVHRPVHAGQPVDIAEVEGLQRADEPAGLDILHNGLAMVYDTTLDGLREAHFLFGARNLDAARVRLI